MSCSKILKNMDSISIRLKSDSESIKLQFSYCDLLYARIRSRLKKNNVRYGHYSYKEDLPQFTLYYNNKPLPERPIHYKDLNVKHNDTIELYYVGLQGGMDLVNTSYATFWYYDTEYSIDYFQNQTIKQLATLFGCQLIADGHPVHPIGIIQAWEKVCGNQEEILPQSLWGARICDLYCTEIKLYYFHWESAYHIQSTFDYRWPESDYEFDSNESYGSVDSYRVRSSQEYTDNSSDRETLPSLDSFSDSETDDSFREQSGLITRTRYLLEKYLLAQVQFDKDFILKLVEDILILVDGLYESYTDNFSVKKIIRTIIIFLKLRNNHSILKMFEDSTVLDFIINMLKVPDEQAGVMDALNTADNVINAIKDGKRLKVTKTLYRLGMFALTLSLFDSFGLTLDLLGYTAFDKEILRKKNQLTGDTVLDLASGVIFLLKKGYQIILTGRVDCIYHTEDEYGQLYDDIADLKAKKLSLNNPEALGFNEYWYGDKLDQTIEKLRNIIKFAGSLDKSEIRYWRSQLGELLLIKNNILIAKHCSESREAPFSLMFFASPGVGKSTLTKLTFQHHAKTHNLPSDDKFMYVRNPMSKYADGFKTEMHTVVIDDIAFKHPNANPTGDITLDEVYMMNGTFQYVPDQAALEDKGKVPMRIKCLLGTTNVKDLNAFHYFSVPSAFQRRFPYIVEVFVKPQYQKDDGSGMLDAAKTDRITNEYPNYWKLKIYKIIVPKKMSQLAESQLLHTFDDINDYTAWLSETSIKHFENEKIMTTSFTNMRDIVICDKCYRNIGKCTCVISADPTLQSGFSKNEVLEGFAYYLALFLYYFFRALVKITTERAYWRVRENIEQRVNDSKYFRVVSNVRRRLFTRIAILSQKKIGYPVAFGALASVLLTCYAIFRFKRTVAGAQFNEQTKEDNISPPEVARTAARPPSPGTYEKELTWIANDKKLCSMDLTPAILSSKQHTRDEFCARIARNVVHLIIYSERDPNKKFINNAIVVKSNVLICNAHFFNNIEDEDFRMILICDELGDGVNDKIEVSFKKSYIFFKLERDLAVFVVHSLVPRRDITPYFAKPDIYTEATGTLISRDCRNGTVKTNTVHNISLQNQYSDSFGAHPFVGPVTFGKSVIKTIDGDCGSALIIHTPKGHFVGSLHRAGNADSVVIGILIYDTELQDLLTNVEVMAVSAGTPKLADQHVLQSLHPKSVFNFIEEGSAMVYGSISNFKDNKKSRVCATLMREYLVREEGYPVDYCAPQLKGYKPHYLAANDLTKPITSFNEHILRACAEAYLEDILGNIPTGEIENLVHKYDMFTAVNGAAGVAFVDSINRSTSTGYPHCTTKRKFLKPLPPTNGLEDPVEFTQEFVDEVQRMINEYLEHRRCHPVYKSTLKDEAVSMLKYLMGKTRVFGSAPVAYVLVQRIYFLSLVRLIQTHKMAFECAIGVIAQSREWELFFFKLKRFPYLVAGDFSKFDKQMFPFVILLAYWVLIKIAAISGNYTDDDIAVMWGIATDTAYPFMLFNGDFVQLFGSNPSGHSLTVIINSIANCLYLRYVYVVLHMENNVKTLSYLGIARTFKRYVELFVYGDDNELSTILKWFTFCNIQRIFKSVGIKYTPPTKDDSSYDFMKEEDLDFLKRSYRYDSDLDAVVAPLSLDSLNKMLTTWVASDTLSPEVQALAVISSAIREYFFHGKEIFEYKRAMFVRLLKHLHLEHGINTTVLPTYGMLVEKFNDASNTILARLPQHSFTLQSGSLVETATHIRRTFMYYVFFGIMYTLGAICGIIFGMCINIVNLYTFLRRFAPSYGAMGSGVVPTSPGVENEWHVRYLTYQLNTAEYEFLISENWALFYATLYFANAVLIYYMLYTSLRYGYADGRLFLFLFHTILFLIFSYFESLHLFILPRLMIQFLLYKISLFRH